jgi:hypothetical protein
MKKYVILLNDTVVREGVCNSYCEVELLLGEIVHFTDAEFSIGDFIFVRVENKINYPSNEAA